MSTVGFILFLVAYVWSVARGIQVSLLCCVLNFIFPPVSQGIYAVYEEEIRAPLVLMGIALVLLYFGGGLSWGRGGLTIN